jgi:hypothetical protein
VSRIGRRKKIGSRDAVLISNGSGSSIITRSYEPEGDLVLPPGFDATEVFKLLDSEEVKYDVHRSKGYYEPTFRAYHQEFIGISGLQRFIDYRRSRLLPS